MRINVKGVVLGVEEIEVNKYENNKVVDTIDCHALIVAPEDGGMENIKIITKDRKEKFEMYKNYQFTGLQKVSYFANKIQIRIGLLEAKKLN